MSHNTLLSKQGDKKDKKAHDRKASTEGAPADKAEKTDKSAKCAYCGKAGHNILVCFKLTADQAAAKSDGTHNKKIAAAIATRVTEDMEEETGFTCYPAITRTLIPAKQMEIILKKPYHFIHHPTCYHLQFDCIHSWQSVQPVTNRRNFGYRRQL